MKRKELFKRLTAVSMSAMMAVTMMPTAAFASEDGFFAAEEDVSIPAQTAEAVENYEAGGAEDFESGEDFSDGSVEATEDLSGFEADPQDGDTQESVSETTPAADATVHMTIGIAGVLAEAEDGSVMADRDVTVKDLDGNGILTYDEALTAAHNAYFAGGAEAGYASADSEYGLMLTKLWGNSTGSCGYWQNDNANNSLNDPVNAGDYLTAFVYKNASLTDGDAYNRFGKKEYETTVDQALSVSVDKASYNAQYQIEFTAFEGAALSAYDSSFQKLATEDYTIDGYNVTFHKAGNYYLATGGTENVNLVPAVTKVTVQDGAEEKQYLSSLQISPMTPVSFTEVFETGKNEFEYKLPSKTVTIRLKAAFSEDAPADSRIKLTYTNSKGVLTKEKDITSSATKNGILVLWVAGADFTAASFTLTVGTTEENQVYTVNMPRVISDSSITITDQNKVMLKNAADVWYLPADGEDTVRMKIANTDGTDLTLNGVPVETTDFFDYTPEFDENNECKLVVVATHEEQSVTNTWILKKLVEDEGITGTCGDNLTWKLKDNVLTISGTGAMSNWALNNPSPGWKDYKDTIESVVIESGVTSVGDYAFSRCYKLKEVSLPDGITYIGAEAFGSCSVLESVSIPSSVVSVGDRAFALCRKLASVTVSVLGTGMFKGCSGLKSVTIKGNVKEIPENAFLDCTALSEVVFSVDVEKIADYGFGNCQSLTKLDLPASVKEMSGLSFDGCSALMELNIDNDCYKSQDGIIYSADLGTLVFCLPTVEGKVTVPDGVTRIGAAAFTQCDKITEIVLPDSVTELGKECFYGCTGLKEMVLPDHITSVDTGVFLKCSSLESVKLPQGLTKIPDSMFKDCSQLAAIELPEGITAVGEYAFYGCENLKSMVLPAGVKSIGAYAFTRCSSISKLVIPDGIKGISKYMLNGCSSLEEIVIPESVTYIEDFAFSGAPLKYVFFKGTEAQWQAISGTKPEFPTWPSKIFYGATHLGDEKDAPVITEQPQDKVFNKGEDASNALRVQIQQEEGASYYFKWYKNTKYQQEDAVPVEGIVSEDGLSSTCTPETEEEGNLFYYCLVEKVDAEGAATWTYSDMVTVAVSAGYFKGYGTPNAPYLLSSTEDIVKLKTLVGEGNNMSGLYFQMTEDITLPEDWEPIGEKIDKDKVGIEAGANLHAFSGIFDGNGKTIIVPADGLPLFGYVIDAYIQNLNIYGERIAGYGLINNMEGVKLSGNAVTIDNVTLKSGSSTLKSGFLGANVTENPFAGCSAGFVSTIRNCTVEKGVVIGYNKDQKMIGSFAGRMQGTIENCVSYATVYGISYVGGIVGTRDNAMGLFGVSNCYFHGTVEASDELAGGIAGGGYSNGTAPNGIKLNITNCASTGTIIGKDCVGGILGGDKYVTEAWNLYDFKGNSFDGTVKATDGTYVGGVIGYYASLDINDDVAHNHYSENCGAAKGIGFVKIVDTDCLTHETESGATYVCSEKYHRSDDPLGADAEKLTTTDPLAAAYVESLEISGDYRTDFYLGEELDLEGISVTAIYSDKTRKEVALSDLTITGYDNTTRGNQTVTLEYEGAKAMVDIRMLRKGDDIKVSFQLLGDSVHGDDGSCHVLGKNNLTGWVPAKDYTVDTNATVFDVIQVSAKEYGFEVLSRETVYGTYIYGIKYQGIDLEEFSNGTKSGWMYTLNGVHTDKGVSAQYLEDGDVIVFHYTDDYEKEDEAQKEAAAVQETLSKLPEADQITLKDKAAVEEARKAYDALSENQKAMIPAAVVRRLTEAENRIAELEKPAEHVHAFDTGKVTKAATCTETGILTYTCKCGETKTETIPATGHKFGNWEKVSDATVFAPKKEARTCSVCKTQETRNSGEKLKATIKVNATTLPLKVKQKTSALKVTGLAKGDSVKSWKSSNKKIFTVSSKGVIKAGKKTGKATLTITLASGLKKKVTVKVQKGTVTTSKIKGLKSSVTLKKGKKLTLKPIRYPITSTQKFTYSSSNKKVATVTSKGVIQAKKKGTARITVRSGKKKYVVKVRVK